jgi:hypothetical protein
LEQRNLDGVGIERVRAKDLQKMDNVKAIPQLMRLGERVGELQVKPAHFAGFPAI